MAKIGFIGTGIMGKPMAQNLQKAGHTLFFSEHFDKAPADLVGDNGIALANPKEVAQEAEFIIVMVPDTPQVEDVLFRDNGIAAGVGAGKVVMRAAPATGTVAGHSKRRSSCAPTCARSTVSPASASPSAAISTCTSFGLSR